MTDEKDEPEPEDEQFWLDVKILDEEIHVDIRDEGKTVDEYWAHGWNSGAHELHRFNSDSYKNRSYKVFPTRYRLRDATLTKSMRRVLNKNTDLKTVIRPLRITEKKEQLHKSYYAQRHDASNRRSLANCYNYIKLYFADLKELCIFKDQKLVACSIFEVGEESLYSHIAFWDLDEKARSLGILTVLLEMQYAVKLGFTHYYLGHYFAKNPIYQYKTRFRGLELYDWDNARWIDFKNPFVQELLTQKLPYA
jgi:leucyl-tRNA---protein transferase